MDDWLGCCPEKLSPRRLAGPAGVVSLALAAGRGVRLGQSTVLSTKVHAFGLHRPEHVHILTQADAGQVFYCRQDDGAVCHLDVFHQCGTVDQRLAARYVRQAIEFYQKAIQALAGADSLSVCPHAIDIQTAAGGGRITGTLSSGQKRSLRRAHENHVHLALRLPPEHVMCLFYTVAAVEAAILNAGLELRRNERISYVDAAGSQADLNHCTDQTDSLLTGGMLDSKRKSTLGD